MIRGDGIRPVARRDSVRITANRDPLDKKSKYSWTNTWIVSSELRTKLGRVVETLEKSSYRRVFRGLVKYDEQIFLAIIFVMTSAMFVRLTIPELLGYEAYRWRIRVFPLAVTTPAMVLSFLFLVRPYLPPKIRVIFEENDEGGLRDLAGDSEELEEMEQLTELGTDTSSDHPAMTGPGIQGSYDSTLDKLRALIPPKIATGLMALGFLAVAMLFGIFWAAPVLVVGYYVWFGKPISYAIIASLFLLGFIYGVGEVLNLTHIIMESPLPEI